MSTDRNNDEQAGAELAERPSGLAECSRRAGRATSLDMVWALAAATRPGGATSDHGELYDEYGFPK